MPEASCASAVRTSDVCGRPARPSVHQPSSLLERQTGKDVRRERRGTTLQPGAQPVARHVQRHGPADAEVCPQQRPREAHRHGAVHPQRQLDLLRHAAQLSVRSTRCRPRAAAARAPVSSARWCARAGAPSRSPAPSLPLFGRDCPPVASTTRRGVNVAAGRRQPEAVAVALDAEDARVGGELGAGALRLVEQRAQDVARLLAVRKQLAVRFFVQADADGPEEFDRVANRQRAENPANDRPAAAPEIGVRHDGVGDVASRAAAHEDLRARPLRAFEQQDGAAGFARRAKIAVASPAAPAPTTAISHERKWPVLRRESLTRKGVRSASIPGTSTMRAFTASALVLLAALLAGGSRCRTRPARHRRRHRRRRPRLPEHVRELPWTGRRSGGRHRSGPRPVPPRDVGSGSRADHPQRHSRHADAGQQLLRRAGRAGRRLSAVGRRRQTERFRARRDRSRPGGVRRQGRVRDVPPRERQRRRDSDPT